MAFVLYCFLFIFLSHPTLSHSISISPDPALSPPYMSNRPLSSEGWVPIWVYSGMGFGMGHGELGCGELGHGLTVEVSGFWWVGSNGVWGGFLHRFENWWWLVVWLAGTSCGGGLMVVGLRLGSDGLRFGLVGFGWFCWFWFDGCGIEPLHLHFSGSRSLSFLFV